MEFLVYQLKKDYKSTVWDVCAKATSVRQASDAMLLKFERPADQSEAVQKLRAGYGEEYYKAYASNSTSSSNTKKEESKVSYSASDVIKVAKQELGYYEKASNASLDDKTANKGSNNWTKYARDLAAAGYYNGNKNGYAWCDVFVDWCHYVASGKSRTLAETTQCQTGDLGAGCKFSAQYYRNQKRFYNSPEVGDQIFFGPSGDESHTGIVIEVTSTKVKTIEGNTSNMVAERTYNLTDSYISGYGRPKYSQTQNLTPTASDEVLKYDKDDIVNFTGTTHYTSSYASGKAKTCKPGEAKITQISKGKAHPYHLKATSGSASTVSGWVNAADISSKVENNTAKEDIKPITLTTVDTSMKYNDSNKPLVCMMTNSTCYLGTRTMTPKGILWHSTGANNPNLKRYVQPSSNDANYSNLITKLGTNSYGNDWNHITHQAGLNAWIGKLADGTVTTVQTMPWNYRPWGCGSGSKGSCNDYWIQFEICEDGLTDKTYFNKVYNEACELTAYLCKLYNINPQGTVNYNGINVPTILCHQDSYQLGLGSNHGDVYHWFKKYDKDMDDVRKDVAKLLSGSSESTVKPITPIEVKPSYDDISVGDEITLASNAVYTSGTTIPSWVFKSTLYAREIRSDSIVFSTLKTGAITGVVSKSYVSKKASGETVFQNYLVRIIADALNVRAGAGTSYKINTTVKKNDVYTIVGEQNGWGKLKSGAGWISLSYTERV